MRARPPRRRALAAALAVGLAAPLAGLAAQQAQAFGPAPVALACATYVGDAGSPTAPQSYSDTLTLDRSPALPAPGNTVTVTLAVATGPNASGATAAASATPRATVALGGTQTGTVALAGAADSYPAAAKSAGRGPRRLHRHRLLRRRRRAAAPR